ncbi:protein IWS1 homolog, partial [Mycetomoellerius zeteki]|uniref:protein IWS1 homolog n=1 Tax=Mycetomoellerius zeteki TaxID=64791 RepID=UPI00084E73C8
EAQYRPTQEELEDDNEDSTRPQGETQNDEERQSEENFESIEEDLEDYDEDPTKPQGGPHNNGERHSEEDFEDNEDTEYTQQEAESYKEQYSQNESEEQYSDNERYEDEHSLPDQERENSSEDEECVNNIQINLITISDSDEEISSDLDSEDTILLESQWKREERGRTLKTTLKSKRDNNEVDRELKQPDNNSFKSIGMSDLPIKKEDHSEEKTAQDQYGITERIFSQSQGKVKTELTSTKEKEENLLQRNKERQDTSKEYEQEHQPENYNETYILDQLEVKKIEDLPELTNRRRNERKAVINVKSILRKSNTRQSAEKCTKRLKDYFINPKDTTDESDKEEKGFSSEEGYKTDGKDLQSEKTQTIPGNTLKMKINKKEVTWKSSPKTKQGYPSQQLRNSCQTLSTTTENRVKANTDSATKTVVNKVRKAGDLEEKIIRGRKMSSSETDVNFDLTELEKEEKEVAEALKVEIERKFEVLRRRRQLKEMKFMLQKLRQVPQDQPTKDLRTTIQQTEIRKIMETCKNLTYKRRIVEDSFKIQDDKGKDICKVSATFVIQNLKQEKEKETAMYQLHYTVNNGQITRNRVLKAEQITSADTRFKKYAMTEARVIDLIKPTITNIEIPSTSKDYTKENVVPETSNQDQPAKRKKQQSSDESSEEPLEKKKQTKAEVARGRPRISGRFVSKDAIKEDIETKQLILTLEDQEMANEVQIQEEKK